MVFPVNNSKINGEFNDQVMYRSKNGQFRGRGRFNPGRGRYPFYKDSFRYTDMHYKNININRHYRGNKIRGTRKKTKIPSRPSSPVPGSEEYMLKKVAETSSIIMQQLLNPGKQIIEKESPSTSIELPIADKTNSSVATKSKKLRQTSESIKYDADEIHDKIMNHILNLNNGRKKNLINAKSTGYDIAIQQIQKQKRLEISQALREITTDQSEGTSDLINSIIPDIGIKIEELPKEVIEQLQLTFDLELDDGNYGQHFGMDYENDNGASNHIMEVSNHKMGESNMETSNVMEDFYNTHDKIFPNMFPDEIKQEPENDKEHESIAINESKLDHSTNELLKIKDEIMEIEPAELTQNEQGNHKDDSNKNNDIGLENSNLVFETGQLESTQIKNPNASENWSSLLEFSSKNKNTEESQEINTTNKDLETPRINVNQYIFQTKNKNTEESQETNKSNKDLETPRINVNQNIFQTEIKNTEESQEINKSNKDLETPRISVNKNIFPSNDTTTLKLNNSIFSTTNENTNVHISSSNENTEVIKNIVDSSNKDTGTEISSNLKTQTKHKNVSSNNEISKNRETVKNYKSSQCQTKIGQNTKHNLNTMFMEMLKEECSLDKSLPGCIKSMHKIDKLIISLTNYKQSLFENLIDNPCSEDKRFLKKRKVSIPNSTSKLNNISTPSCKKSPKKSPNNKGKNSNHNIEKTKKKKFVASECNTLNFEDIKEKVLVVQVFNTSVIAATESGKIYFFNSKTSKLEHTLEVGSVPLTALCLVKELTTEPNNDPKMQYQMYVGSFDCNLKVYDSRYNLVKTESLDDSLICMTYCWDYIFMGCKRGSLIRYSVKKEKIEYTDKISESSVLVLKATHEGARRVLLVGTRNSPVCIRDAFTGLHMRTLENSISPTVYSLLLEKSVVYCGTTVHDILSFSFHNGNLLHKYNASKMKGIGCMQIFENLLFASCHNGSIYVYNTTNHKLIDVMKGPGGVILSMTIINYQIIVGTMSFQFKAIPIPQFILNHIV